MHKTSRTKLYLSIDTLRHLRTADLGHAQGGIGPSIAPANTCSQCLAGCQTGDACAAPESWQNTQCWNSHCNMCPSI
jgi:hypothetical protein